MELVLEKFKFTEVNDVQSLWSDESATLYTNFPYLPTKEQCQQRLSKMMNYYGQRDDHFGPFSIRTKNGEFLGLTGGDAGANPGEYEIWYFVKREMWGKNVASTAVATLLQLMKNSGTVKSIKATAVINNEPSWRFLEKLGLQRVETIPQGHKKDDLSWDLYVYAMSIK